MKSELKVGTIAKVISTLGFGKIGKISKVYQQIT